MTFLTPDEMTKQELVDSLLALQETTQRVQASDGETKRLVHELQVHQVELEMQNRELRDAHGLLEESRSRYVDLYDFAPVGYCTFDHDGKVLEINLSGASLLGAPRERIVGRLFESRVRGDARIFFARHLQKCLALEARVVTELDLSATTGEPCVVQLVTRAGVDRAAGFAGFRTTMHDVSALRSHEKRLAFFAEAGMVLPSSLDFQTTIAAVARLAVPTLADICIVDTNGPAGAAYNHREVAVRDAVDDARAALAQVALPGDGPGSPRDQLGASGRPVLLFRGCDHVTRLPESAAAMRALSPSSLLVVPLRVRGQCIGAMTFVALAPERRYAAVDVVFAEGIAARAACAIDNASLHRRTQDAVAARQALLALVSHDLRNPLGVMLLGAALLLDLPAPDDRRKLGRKTAESILRAGRRMERLIRDLLDVANLESANFTVDKEVECIASMIKEGIEMARPSAMPKNVRIECDLAAVENHDVECDLGRLLQVLGNLLGNAVKFSSPGSRVQVRAWLNGPALCVAISDEGPGIAPDALPHVFDRLWQARPTARLGSGLGLCIAKGIVEAHGGQIWVESVLGEGSTFFFTLHREEREPRQKKPSSPTVIARAGRRSGTVVVVDDDADGRETLGDTLRFHGFAVVLCRHGGEAVAYLQSAIVMPKLIVVDLDMPVVDGWGFLAERARQPLLAAIPTVVLTAQPGVADRVKSSLARHLDKPLRIARLISLIDSLG